jgi:hypothetical protein
MVVFFQVINFLTNYHVYVKSIYAFEMPDQICNGDVLCNPNKKKKCCGNHMEQLYYYGLGPK